MVMAIIGLLAPFLPDVLGLLRGHLDHKYEMEIIKLQIERDNNAAAHRMEEVVVQAQAAENIAARKAHKSYGVQLLQAADEPNSKIWGWSFNVVFLAFAVLDWLISSVRPVVTYWTFVLYVVVKAAILIYIYQASAKYSAGTFEAAIKTFTNEDAWNRFDQEMFMLILGFWFGNRLKSGRSNASAQS